MRRWAGCLLLLRHPDLFQLWAGCTIFLTVWGLSSDSIADGIFPGGPGRSSETRLQGWPQPGTETLATIQEQIDLGQAR